MEVSKFVYTVCKLGIGLVESCSPTWGTIYVLLNVFFKAFDGVVAGAERARW